MPVQEENFNDFRGGLVTDPPAYLLQKNQYQQMSGMFIQWWGGLTLRKTQRQVATQATYSGLSVLAAYRRRTTNNVLFFALADNTFAMYNENTTTRTPLIGSGVPGDYLIKIVPVPGGVAWNLAAGGIRMWDASSLTVRSLGISGPGTAPTVASGGAGLLETTSLPPVRYYVTYVSAFTESNPSPISNGVAGSLFQVNLTAIPTGPAGTVSRRIYRVGGTLTKPTLITTLANNTATTYADNNADSTVGTTYLSFSRDPAPSDAGYVLAAKGRVILANTTTVYVSNLNDPDAYPLVITNRATDGFQFRIDRDSANKIVGLADAGSGVIIARERDIYLLQGSDTDSWSIQRVANIGVSAPKSLVACEDKVVWFGQDKMIWMLGAAGPVPLGRPIWDTLQALQGPAILTACACYMRRQYHISFAGYAPAGQTGKYFVYDFDSECWFDFSATYMGANDLHADPQSGTQGEVLLSYDVGFSDGNLPDGTVQYGVSALFYQPGRAGFTIQSSDFDFGYPKNLKKIHTVRVRGIHQQYGISNPQTVLTLTATTDRQDGSVATVTRSFYLNPGNGVATLVSGILLDTDVSADVQGHRISWTITNASNGLTFDLHDVNLGWELLGEGRK